MHRPKLLSLDILVLTEFLGQNSGGIEASKEEMNYDCHLKISLGSLSISCGADGPFKVKCSSLWLHCIGDGTGGQGGLWPFQI